MKYARHHLIAWPWHTLDPDEMSARLQRGIKPLQARKRKAVASYLRAVHKRHPQQQQLMAGLGHPVTGQGQSAAAQRQNKRSGLQTAHAVRPAPRTCPCCHHRGQHAHAAWVRNGGMGRRVTETPAAACPRPAPGTAPALPRPPPLRRTAPRSTGTTSACSRVCLGDGRTSHMQHSAPVHGPATGTSTSQACVSC